MKLTLTRIFPDGHTEPCTVSDTNVWRITKHDGGKNPQLKGKTMLKMSDGRNIVVEESATEITEQRLQGRKLTPGSAAALALLASAGLLTKAVMGPSRMRKKRGDKSKDLAKE
jgi:hypothetical protein